MLRFPFRPSAEVTPSPTPGVSGWLRQRQVALSHGLRIWPLGLVITALLARPAPTAALMVGALSLIGLFVTLGAFLAFQRIGLRLQAATPASPPTPTRVPKVRTYATLNEGALAGWRFFDVCGTYAQQPIPRWAELDGAWFAYQGLDLDARSTADTERVFGALTFASAPAPADPQVPVVLPAAA